MVTGTVIGSALTVCSICIVVLAVIIFCYRRSERPQTVQLSRASTAPGPAAETDNVHRTASAFPVKEKAGESPPSYSTICQQYVYSYPRELYEMHQYYPRCPPPANPTTSHPDIEPHYW